MNEQDACIVRELTESLPDLTAAYLFGSRARGDQTAESDYDVAILGGNAIAPVRRWELQERLASALHRPVDLVDLRAASTVMRVKVLESSRVLVDRDPSTRARFEATALKAYAQLNEERRAILDEVRRTGTVHG